MPGLTLVTYNLWGYHTPAEYLKRRGKVRGATPDSPAATLGPTEAVWRKRRARLLSVLEDADQDVIAVQENVRRPNAPDRSHAQQLGRALGMTVIEGTFYPEIDAQGKPYEMGVALLTHLSVDGEEEADLPYSAESRIGGSPRLLQTLLDLEGEPLHVWVTHFPSKDDDADRACAERIVELASGLPEDEPLLVCGDLNSTPDSAAIRALTGPENPSHFLDLWAAAHPGEEGLTMATPEPDRRLDYVLLRLPAASLRLDRVDIIGDTADEEGWFPSDHCGLRATFHNEPTS